MEFNTPHDRAFNMQLDILADIYCWQQVIIDRMASREAEKKGCPKKEAMEVLRAEKALIRERLIEQLYGKHGPDLSEDLGL